MSKEKEPTPIILVTYKRLHLLRRVIKNIYDNTCCYHQLFVVNNDANDNETIRYLKQVKSFGYIDDFINLPKNLGLSNGFKEGFEFIKNKNKSKWVVFTQDDCLSSYLRPCWLERVRDLIQCYQPDYGAICLRIERTRRRDIDESKELIPSDTACPAIFRISSKKLIEEIGFSSRPHWESHEFSKRVKALGKKMAMATHLYASHIGFVKNKGYEEGFKEYLTYAGNRETQHTDQPYPDIDPLTKIPLKIHTPRDLPEHEKRLAFWKLYGFDAESLILAKEILKYKGEIGKYKNWEEYWNSEDGKKMKEDFFIKQC